MCAVSQISDYGRKHLWRELPQLVPFNPPGPDWRDAEIARLRSELEKYAKFQEAVEAARRLDVATGQPDCPDPEKAKWLESLDARMKQIEEALGLR
jgi:hypothetical protein